MLKMKKIFASAFTGAILFVAAQGSVFGAYTAPDEAERQFSEDFEEYQILKREDEYNPKYYMGDSVYSSVINVAPPSDDTFYTTYIDKYPNGTASVYEGNLADVGMTVHDPSGKQVLGGTKNIGQDDGWFGYYNGENGNYNIYNRRLSVMGRNGVDEINQTQYASLNPRVTSDKLVTSELNRNNVVLDGYSYISARVNLSREGSVDKFGKAGIAITKNPNGQMADANYDAVYFTDSETEGMLDVYFNGKALEQKVTMAQFEVTSSNVISTGEWYTIQYRIYNSGAIAKHKLTIIDDKNKTVVVNTDWTDMQLDDSGFNFADGNIYGIKFYAHARSNEERVRMRLDDISFFNEEYVEDFDSYNIEVSRNGSGSSRIGNGFKGNRNTTTYENGVYEGNMAKNVFVHHVLQEGTSNWDMVFGNIPQWQGYVKVVEGVNEFRTMDTNEAQIWWYPCAVVLPEARNQAENGFDTQALVMRANSAKPQKPQISYAGMDTVDFSDETTISGVIKIQQVTDVNSSLTLQLTKGRDTAVAGSKNYTDSHTAYYDVFQMRNNQFYVDNTPIGSYEVGQSYKFEYTVDLVDKQDPRHELKIFNYISNDLVASMEETEMNVVGGAENFNFENDVTGFRFVNDAPTYKSESEYGDIVTYIDDIKVKKTIPVRVIGDSNISNAVYSAEANTLTCTVNLAEAVSEKSVAIFAVYDNNDILQQVYTREYETLRENANAIEIPVAQDYDAGSYYGKVFLWSDFDTVLPRTDAVYAQMT